MFDLVNKPKLILPQISTVQHTSRETLSGQVWEDLLIAWQEHLTPYRKKKFASMKRNKVVWWYGEETPSIAKKL